MKILVVDDDPEVVEIVTAAFNMRWLEAEVLHSRTGEAAPDIVEREHLDLVLLDIGMPGTDGYQTLQQIREFSDVPVIMLTCRSTVPEKVRALRLGADDYVTKPFDSLELLARVEALLRRIAGQPVGHLPPLASGRLWIDFDAKEVRVSGVRVHLTALEYKLLHLLARNPGRVLPNETLLTRVWGPSYVGETNYLRVYVRRLRRKLEEDPNRPQHIVTERGLGYRFREAA